MSKITFKKYMEMMHEAEEKHGAIYENEISEKDWNNPLIKDEDMPGLTLTWDMELQEWCVFGPPNRS